MATTSIPHRWKYDVFVSFRGEDIRKNFMDHMFNHFKQKGIHAFRDNNELPKGEKISPHLYKAIEESRFLIVIFSKNYASSTWCLKELVKILECTHIENPKYEVRIIFYDVKPDVVRKQKRSYAEAFRNHEVSNSEEVGKWKEALSMAANLSGFDLQDMTNGYESKFIDNISKEILKVISDGPLDVAQNLVDLDARVRKLNLLRFVGSDKVHMIGICGFSGLGKTTLAKAVYNSMYTYFEGRCFCDDVQGVTKRQGLTQVQMQMFIKILKTENLRISSVSEGTKVIKQRVACKPILLVLDDVNDLEQLEALAGSHDWFSPGSLIIFTGKDKQLLRSHKVDEIYEVEILDDNKALELFSLNAFGKRHPTKEFEELAFQIVKYLQGHPLALKVIGRSLYGKSAHLWKSELDRLQTYPNADILQKLRPSFDALASDQKQIFLDIACSFIGEHRDFTASVLDTNSYANANIEVLVDKFLITVSANDMSLQMHELVQSMAREITREEFNMPGNQKRLWISTEFYDALNKNKVTEEVEVLVLLLHNNGQCIPIDGKAFTCMKNLRILKICFPKVKGCWQPFAVKMSGSLDFLSDELRLFCWHGCPFKYLPSHFYPENIVAIDISYSNIKQLWTTPKCFRRLKVMKLRYCCNLTTTKIGLDLMGCLKIGQPHETLGWIRTAITKIPSLPTLLTSITTPFGLLSKQQHPQRQLVFSSLAGLHMLKVLNFSYCNLEQVPESIGGLSCLEILDLKGNNFSSLPGSLSQIYSLDRLNVSGCKKLEVFPELPPSVEILYASDCTSLREVLGSSKDRRWYNNFTNCPKLFKNVSIDSEGSTSKKTKCVDSSITSQGSIVQKLSAFHNLGLQFFSQDKYYSKLDIIYHGNSIPKWFRNKSLGGNHVKVELPSQEEDYWYYDKKLRGHGTCVVFKGKKPFTVTEELYPDGFEWYSVKNFDGASLKNDYIPRVIQEYLKKLEIGIQEESYIIWLCYRNYILELKEAKKFVTFSFFEELINEDVVEVKECGVSLICDEDIKQDDVTMLSMFHDLPTPTQNGGATCFSKIDRQSSWSW